MTPRKTIGENPLDALVPPKVEKRTARERTEPQEKKAAPTRKAPEPPQEARHGAKERLTVHLPLEVIDRAKNAVYWSPGLTLAGLAEAAFVKALEKLEKENGGPFSPRKGELKGGRPMK